MGQIKVPSLQHLSRIWRPDPQAVKKILIGLAKHGPTFSYDPLYAFVRDMLVLRVPYEQIVESVERGIKREDVRANYLGLLPLIRDHFEGVSVTFVQGVSERYYPVSRGLMVPFRPPLIYGAAGEIHFPWFSFWKTNPLESEQLSLFVTIVEEVLLQDPDLENAKFSILDFSCPKLKGERELKVIDARLITRLTDEKKKKMLSIFAEGFSLAKKESLNFFTENRNADKKDDDSDQIGLFDIPGA